MKYSHVSAVLLALALSCTAQQTVTKVEHVVVVEEKQQPGGGAVPVAPGPPPPAPPAQGVEEKVKNPPANQPPPITSATTLTSSPVPSPSPPPSNPQSGGSGSGSGGGQGGGSGGSSGGKQSSSGEICVNFSGGDFHFANAGSWGSKTGHGASDASQCFGMVAGGAMFICEDECNKAGDAAPAKYTKLECNFEGNMPNCDISLVDGFSLPLKCTIPGSVPEVIGGLTDLTTLASCPGGLQSDNTCPNLQGYASSQSSVSSFFQNANQPSANQKAGPGGNYCMWQFCSGPSDSFWPPSSHPTISCEVGTRSASKKRDTADAGVVAAEIETRNLSDAEVLELDEHVKRHVGGAHSHAAAHARNLKNLV